MMNISCKSIVFAQPFLNEPPSLVTNTLNFGTSKSPNCLIRRGHSLVNYLDDIMQSNMQLSSSRKLTNRGRNSPRKFLSPGIGDPRKIKIFPRGSPGNNFLSNSPMIKRIFSNFSAKKASCFMRSYIFLMEKHQDLEKKQKFFSMLEKSMNFLEIPKLINYHQNGFLKMFDNFNSYRIVRNGILYIKLLRNSMNFVEIR